MSVLSVYCQQKSDPIKNIFESNQNGSLRSKQVPHSVPFISHELDKHGTNCKNAGNIDRYKYLCTIKATLRTRSCRRGLLNDAKMAVGPASSRRFLSASHSHNQILFLYPIGADTSALNINHASREPATLYQLQCNLFKETT